MWREPLTRPSYWAQAVFSSLNSVYARVVTALVVSSKKNPGRRPSSRVKCKIIKYGPRGYKLVVYFHMQWSTQSRTWYRGWHWSRGLSALQHKVYSHSHSLVHTGSNRGCLKGVVLILSTLSYYPFPSFLLSPCFWKLRPFKSKYPLKSSCPMPVPFKLYGLRFSVFEILLFLYPRAAVTMTREGAVAETSQMEVSAK